MRCRRYAHPALRPLRGLAQDVTLFRKNEKAKGIAFANPVLRPLRGLAQDVTLFRKNEKAKGIAFAQSRKSEEPRLRR
jgi:hypothetical protein